jgi:hypothetical protein
MAVGQCKSAEPGRLRRKLFGKRQETGGFWKPAGGFAFTGISTGSSIPVYVPG